MASVKNEQTVVGNIGNVYEPRTVGKDNRSVIDFSVAVTPRVRNAQGEWEDGDTTWVNCTAWDRLADNIEGSFATGKGDSRQVKKGDRVIVIGKVRTKPEYTKDDGTVIPAREYISVDYIGIELGFVAAHSERGEGGRGGASSNGPARASKPAAKKPAAKKETSFDDLDDLDLDGDEPF